MFCLPITSTRLAIILLIMSVTTISPGLPLEAKATVTCYTCHGTRIDSFTGDFRPQDKNSRDIESGGFQGNHQTHMGSTLNAEACNKCHPGSSGYQTSHRDGKIKITSRINNSPLLASYKNSTSAWPQSASPSLGTCSNVNCHFESDSPIWGDVPLAAPGQCNICHGTPPSGTGPVPAGGAAGSHARHNTYYTGVSNCIKCHADHTADSNKFAHATSVGRRGLIVLLRTPSNSPDGNYLPAFFPITTILPSQAASHSSKFGTCQNTYCHGTTMSVANDRNGGSSNTPAWGNPSSGQCGTCHGSTAANPPRLGSHLTHAGSDRWWYGDMFTEPFNNYIWGRQMPCATCHKNEQPRHVNGNADWSFDSPSKPWLSGARYSLLSSGSKAPVPSASYGQCGNLYCHSIVQTATGQPLTGLPGEYKTPTWGSRGEGNCGTCHPADGAHSYWAGKGNGAPEIGTGSHAKHLQYLTIVVGGGSNGASRCAVCHNYAGNAASLSDLNGCSTICHNNFNLHADHQIDVRFASYFGPGGTYNGTPAPGNGFSSCSNIYCHSNGSSVATGTVPANTTKDWGSTPLSCTDCHSTPPAYGNGTPKANSHSAHSSQSCNICHYSTTSNGTVITTPANHVNKTYNVAPDSANGISFSYTFSSSGGSCNSISCHGTTNAQWGAGACLGCHSVTQGNRAAITSQFGSGSHHIQGTITNAHCYQCHWEANSDGSINHAYHGGAAAPGAPVDLVIYGSGSRPEAHISGTFVTYSANGSRSQISKINNHCLGCHSEQNNTTEPFGDNKTPRQYAWDEKSIDARYSQPGTTTWGKYTSANTAKKKINKTFSAHGNSASNQRGWNTSTGVDGTIANTGATSNVQCYDCHNSHGSTVSGITSRYSSATGRNRGAILKDTLAGKGGYSVSYKPYTTGSLADKNRLNPGGGICLDCHLNQTAGTETVPGTSTPWGYGSTFGASQPIIGYWDKPKYKSFSTAGSQKRYPFKAMNSVLGGHFGASSQLSAQPSANNRINGLCTPCHDPHGVSPTLGANQEYAVPLLKGTWLTSPYKEDTAPASKSRFTARPDLGTRVPFNIDQNTFATNLTDSVSGISQPESQTEGLCITCHTKDSLTDGVTHTWKNKNRIHESVKGWKTANGTVQHNYSCSKCHAPHSNSVLPRLMVTNCLDNKHKGATGWSADAILNGSGNGQAICCIPVCSEIPYSFRQAGHANMSGGYGWCASKGNWAARGSGGGRFPGSWRSDVPGVGNYSVACHENQTGNVTDQSWNEVTTWVTYPNMTISSETVAAVSGQQATISWSTNIPSSSKVYYGSAAGFYNYSAAGPTFVQSHTASMTPANHATYHYQVKSVANDGQQVFSNDATFRVSAPPSVPDLVTKFGTFCSSSCEQTLQWSTSNDPDGGQVSYQLQVASDSGFTSIAYDSGWIPGTSTTTTALATNSTWWWRVQAKDAEKTIDQDPTSGWSSPGSFVLSNSPPSAPTIGTATATSTSSIRWNFTDNSNNEDGFRLHDPFETVKGSATPNSSYMDESGLTANTQYSRHLHAYNTGGESSASASASRYTLAVPPNVTANITAPGLINVSGVTFSNAAVFGSGGVAYYRTWWDQNPTYDWSLGYSWWGSGNRVGAPTSEGSWYFHVQSRNGDEIISGQQDYGPYYYDITPPNVTGFSATSPWDTNLSIPITSFTANDNASGVTGYMITTGSQKPLAWASEWTSTPPTTFTVPGPGTYTLYPWAKDLAGNVSAVSSTPLTVVIMMFDASAPSGIANSSPADNETGITTTVSIKSSSATDNTGGPVQYWFQVALDSGFTSGVQNSGWQAATSYNPSLNLNTTYYWRVKARDASFNETAYTTPWSFTPAMIPVTWTTRGDFESNASTTGTATTRNLVTLSGINPGDNASVMTNPVRIVSGDYHALALKNDGTVWSWGYNWQGQLGDGANTQKSSPAQIAGLSGVLGVAAGSNHSLAVKSDGSVMAWGFNASGQLGDGSTSDKNTPVPVSGLSEIIAVAGGASHSLALKSDGTVWFWGSGFSITPSKVSSLNNIVFISAGVNTSFAVKADGTLWRWSDPSSITQVAGISGVSAVAAGNGRYVALKSDGTVWAWGNGPLGDGQIAYSSTPVQVLGLTNVSAVTAGMSHSMALRSDGTVWGWGENTSYGLLGENSTGQRTTAVQIPSFTGVTAIAAGTSNSMAAKSDGTVWTWGYTGYGMVPAAPNYKIPNLSSMAGASFVTPSTISNLKFNAGSAVTWGSIYWNVTTPTTTAIKFRTRGAASEAELASATWSSLYTISESAITTAASQWLEVELTLQPNGSLSPRLNDFSITYRP